MYVIKKNYYVVKIVSYFYGLIINYKTNFDFGLPLNTSRENKTIDHNMLSDGVICEYWQCAYVTFASHDFTFFNTKM